jgi:hypothetical protein
VEISGLTQKNETLYVGVKIIFNGNNGRCEFSNSLKCTELAKVNGVFRGIAGYDNLIIYLALIFVNFYCNLSYRAG